MTLLSRKFTAQQVRAISNCADANPFVDVAVDRPEYRPLCGARSSQPTVQFEHGAPAAAAVRNGYFVASAV
jgi:hypothetical protein